MGFIVLWDLVIKENIESEEVVILRPGMVLHEFDEITADSLMVEKRNRATLVEGYLKPSEIQSVVGKQVKQTLVGNQLVSARYIDMEDFLPDPNKGESIRPIPNQWIYALPATVRRKDAIDIYLVQSDEAKAKMKELGNVIATSANTRGTDPSIISKSPEQEKALEDKDKANAEEDAEYSEERESIASNTPSLAVSAEGILGEKQDVLDYVGDRAAWLEKKGLTAVQWTQLIEKGDMPLLVDVPVAYAKDSAGNEILNNPGEEVNVTDKKGERLTATGAIVNLELLLTEDNHRILLGYINQGYQLYITYN